MLVAPRPKCTHTVTLPKARFIGEGIFAQIHQIRKSDVATVREALAAIDNGGFWHKKSSS
jgi:hypothetical protein